MKNVILFIAFITFTSEIYCQRHNLRIQKSYECLNSLITDTLSANQCIEIFNLSQSEVIDKLKTKGIDAISNSQLRNFLLHLTEYSLPICIRKIVEQEIQENRLYRNDNKYISNIISLEYKLKIIDEYIEKVTEVNYEQYSYQESSNRIIKSFYAYHDNDAFLFSPLNGNRDYTGGFRFEFMTDYLKLRVFQTSEKHLSYQSFFIGGEGFTPHIRFTESELKERGILYVIDPETQFFTQESLQAIEGYMKDNQQHSDRPFASFTYIGRVKYRLHNFGHMRTQSQFKLGVVGGKVGKNIQDVIHQDLTVGTQRVLNWDDQIANGGRLALNIEHKLDLSLFNKHSIFQRSKNINNKFLNRLAYNTNIYLPFEVTIGTVNTHLGVGIGMSNKSFADVSGINCPKYIKDNSRNLIANIWANSYVSIEYNYRNVIHNSMLEGVGIINPFKDDPLDDEAITVYKLDHEDIQRNLHMLTFSINTRVKNMTFFYRQKRFINKEFTVKDSVPAYSEFQTLNWYGYGTVGFNFQI